jgi:predicted histidine transporter YuiF (NhaC family)
MFRKYRDIFYGGIIGLGAAFLDTFIDAQTQQNSIVDQITQYPTVMLERAIFLLFGLAIGFLVWRNRRRERDFQRVFAAAERLQQGSDKQALLINTKIQVLLTRDDFHFSPQAQELLRGIYDSSKQLQTLVRDKLV